MTICRLWERFGLCGVLRGGSVLQTLLFFYCWDQIDIVFAVRTRVGDVVAHGRWLTSSPSHLYPISPSHLSIPSLYVQHITQ